ncbi:SAM-dependent methyltransferase [Deinobacterium chartae]|uniref:SAM-dependent methyltransferase n=1 Tax=Deinobacterium chartae TaxID=521158 RepID=A0A841HYY4_9DEIO|nr:hypothetical protein [Deinobacterium chartae]MBB6098113.1 SAM-dependent methyltransferase [Deinobacterium chartae]
MLPPIASAPATPFLEFERLHAWLRELEHDARVHFPPTLRDARTLDTLLENLWAAAPDLGRGSTLETQFRAVLNPLFLQSPTLRRIFEKPLGYAGDFLMMEALYQDSPAGETPLGRWIDEWALALPGFAAVRWRRHTMAHLLRTEHARGARRVFSVACGSARELADTARLGFDVLALLDQDATAIQAAADGITRASDPACPPQVQLWPKAIRSLFRPDPAPLSAPYDVIYAMGLYDYLEEATARRLTERLWQGVKPGGLLVIGNFNTHQPMRHFAAISLDWHLVYRDLDDLRSLGAGLEGLRRLQVITDPNGCLHLLLLRRQP